MGKILQADKGEMIMKIEIKNRWSGDVIVSGDYESIKIACIENKADLSRADLRGADLEGANLVGANLVGAKNYAQSHDIFTEICKREQKSLQKKTGL